MAFIKSGKNSTRHFSASKMVMQKTLKTSISCTGVALHSGKKISMTLKPAEENSGIQFRRIDIGASGDFIPAIWDHVVDTKLNTCLGNTNDETIGTVEHLMAALLGCGIDNAVIEINGAEVPIMDGSSAPFVFLIECAGIAEQSAERRVIRLHKPVTINDGDSVVSLTPADGFSLDFEIDFDNPAVSRQNFSVGLVNGTFKRELSRARTFGFLNDVERLWDAGLAKGGSLDNAVVISGDKIMNEDGLRFNDEFVRHKILDAVGDLYLAGAPVIGRFLGVCSGHTATNRLLHAVFADKAAWSYDTISVDEQNSKSFDVKWPKNEAAVIAVPA